MTDKRQKSFRVLEEKVRVCSRERKRGDGLSLLQMNKVRITLALKFCGERSQGPWCWAWTYLLSILSVFLLSLALLFICANSIFI